MPARPRAVNAVYRVDWVPGTDRLRGTCHCGATGEAEDPAVLVAVAAGAPGTSRSPWTRDGVMGQETGLDLVVAHRTAVAEGVVTLDLRDPAGAPLPAWAPGAHIDLMLGPGLIRQFSLCGDPADRDGWRIAVLREPAGRGGSAYVHDAVGAGSRVRVRGPRNHFPLKPAARYLFIAGGIGITPILPMLAAVARRGPPVDADLRRAHRRFHGLPRRPAGPLPRTGADPAPG